MPTSNENSEEMSTNPEGSDELIDLSSITNEVESLRAEKQSLYENLARVQADFQNSRKRIESDFDSQLSYANQGMIKALLPIIDNFERALSQDVTKVDAATLLKGMQLVHDQWLGELARQGVVEIAPSIGDAFNPDQHQALMQQQSELPEGSITLLLQKGYSMKGRVLRAAQVAVSQGKA